MPISPERYSEFTDPVDGTVWLVDIGFVGSRWSCIWDCGCKGIEDRADPDAGLGCCSVGARFLDEEEAMTVAALAATIDPQLFEHAVAAADSVTNDDRSGTRVVDGACVFLNRPGFGGGSGCALQLAALADGEDPMDWKPSVCWQLPLKVDHDGDRRVLRRWRRSDWGSGGETMAWCCTEEPEPLVAADPVAVGLAAEIEALVGPEVAVAIRRHVGA
ncbi:MAG: hypothetical protein AAF480_14270 [Actinomycetota bacterium]